MKVNLKLLKRLYLINHPSGNEVSMINFILNYCYKIPKLEIELDNYNNLFITKSTSNVDFYPCIVAHMDSVHDMQYQRDIVMYDDTIFAINTQFDKQCGLNADDCNGILIALQMLETLPNLKVCFTVEEEIGGIGASKASQNAEFFSDVSYLLQADRKHSGDLIIHTNGIQCASQDFINDISEITKEFSYNTTYGTFTDIGVLAEDLGISGVNISCGYYNEHTPKEYTVLSELQNCLNYIYKILTTVVLDKQYTIDVVSSAIPCDKCRTFDCYNCHYYNDIPNW